MIDKIVSHKSCFGCEACYNACPKNAISFTNDLFGFKVPSVDYSKCINCGHCLTVCPFINKYIGKPNLPYVCSARIKDDLGLFESTSGGIFTAISDYVLVNKGYVCAAIYDDGFFVHHEITNTRNKRDAMRGSKYVQSSIGDCYKNIKNLLENKQKVLFVGTPCQVHGLKLYLSKKYNNLLTADIVCHGVPSPLFFSNFLSFLKNKYGDIKNVKFRSKKYGWKGNNLEIVLMNGRSLCNNKDTKKYTDLFGRGYLMRNCCFECNYSTIFRIGDFSLGDFWGIENVESILNDNKGCSVVFINTQNAKNCFNIIRQNLIVEQRNIPDVLQHNLIKPTKKPNNYGEVQKLLLTKNYWKNH